MSKFAERLKYLRKKNSITQIELGRYLSFGATAISSYENSRHEPEYDILLKIASYFHVSVDYLLGYDLELSICTPEEAQLIEKYRLLKDSDKQLIIALLRSLTEE